MLAAIVLAAGASRRFGGAKQLARLGDRHLLEHAIAAACGAGVDEVVVVLGGHAREILDTVDLGCARPVVCDAWEEGQGASLRAGVDAVRRAEAVVLMLGDQPLVTSAAVSRVIAGRGGGAPAVRATYDGVPSHPVLVEASLFGRLLQLEGDRGAREVLAAVDTRLVACDGVGCPDDVDTPEALTRVESALRLRAGSRVPPATGA